MRRAALRIVACGLAASCSLGLDESLIDRVGAWPPDASFGEAGPPDAGDGGSAGLATACTKDEECKGPNACLVGRCDLARRTCAYDVCRPQACSVAACDPNAHTCGAPKPYAFKAAQFPVGAGVGCGGAPTRCFAAVYPFVFVGTTNGVFAFRAADPSATAPAPVAVTGLAFQPVQLLSSGNRVFFLGQHFGAGAGSRVPLAWIDVPVDPFAKAVAATSVLATWNKPATDAVGLSVAEGGSAYLMDTSAAASFATTRLQPPMTEPLALSGAALPFTPGSVPVAPSGTRFLMQLLAIPPASTTGTPSYGFISGVGTAGAANGGLAPLNAVASVSPSVQTFAASSAGEVLWVAESLTGQPGGPLPAYVRAVRAYFLVASGASNVDAAAGVDLVTYPPAPQYANGQALIGPAALVDGNAALVSAVPTGVAGPPFSQTDVMFITKAPLGLVKNADASVRKLPIPVAPGSLGAAASRGIGYVLVSESPTASSVYVLDPACAP